MTIDDRYRRLLARRAPIEERVFEKYAEAYEAQSGTTTKYILGAMRPVDTKYTQRLVEQGDRVENQLSHRLQDGYPGVEFRRQGSVSNVTHIRFFSDVDVLVLIDKFFTLEPPQRAAYPYQGSPDDDLAELRRRCVRDLSVAFPAVEIDDGGSTAVKMVKSASLTCDVDVVPANWYDTVAFAASRNERDRAVQVFDRANEVRRKNSPFLFNHRLHEHDVLMRGVPRMLIRLLKTVKADLEEDSSDELEFSSFDICSVVYRFHRGTTAGIDRPLELVAGELRWMLALAQNEDARSGVKVVDDSREIFDSRGKVQAFAKLVTELGSLWMPANQEQNQRVLLTEAHWR